MSVLRGAGLKLVFATFMLGMLAKPAGAQASSSYFTTLAKSATICDGISAFCAVKITQAGLD